MTGTPQLADLVADLATLRERGLAKLHELQLPALGGCVASHVDQDPGHLQGHHVEKALRAAIGAMGAGDAADCVAVLFGVDPAYRGLHPRELRKRAAEIFYDDQRAVDNFRKTREPRILTALATALLAINDSGPTSPMTTNPGPAPAAAPLPDVRLVVDQAGWRPRTLPLTLIEPQRRGQLRELTWPEFGQGIDTLRAQIHHYGTTLDIDLAIGINEAGLLMATLLASASFGRCAIGYIRTRSRGTSLRIDETHSLLGPQLAAATAVMFCDFEVKTSHVLSQVTHHLADAGLPDDTPRYFAVMGALVTEDRDLADLDLSVATTTSRLACQPVLQAAGLTDAFIAGLMAAPGIDPPLGLR